MCDYVYICCRGLRTCSKRPQDASLCPAQPLIRRTAVHKLTWVLCNISFEHEDGDFIWPCLFHFHDGASTDDTNKSSDKISSGKPAVARPQVLPDPELPPPDANPTVTSLLQMGQSVQRWSHSSMQLLWKTWLHGSGRTISSSSKSDRHTMHCV